MHHASCIMNLSDQQAVTWSCNLALGGGRNPLYQSRRACCARWDIVILKDKHACSLPLL